MVRGLCSLNHLLILGSILGGMGIERHPLIVSPLVLGPTVPEGLAIGSALMDTPVIDQKKKKAFKFEITGSIYRFAI